MSIEDKAEEAAYDALRQVGRIPRPKERERICMNIMKLTAEIIGYKLVESDN